MTRVGGAFKRIAFHYTRWCLHEHWTCYIATLHNANCRTTDTSTRKTNLTARKRISDWKALSLSVSFSRSFSTPSILLLFDARKISITLPLASALARAIMPSTMTEFDWQSGRDERRTVFVPTLKTTLRWVHRVILCYCGIFVMRFTRYLMSFYVVFFCICVVFLMNICNVKSTLGWKSSMNVMNAFEVRNESVQWHFETYLLIDIKTVNDVTYMATPRAFHPVLTEINAFEPLTIAITRISIRCFSHRRKNQFVLWLNGLRRPRAPPRPNYPILLPSLLPVSRFYHALFNINLQTAHMRISPINKHVTIQSIPYGPASRKIDACIGSRNDG